jgi:hypothetical protein
MEKINNTTLSNLELLNNTNNTNNTSKINVVAINLPKKSVLFENLFIKNKILSFTEKIIF